MTRGGAVSAAAAAALLAVLVLGGGALALWPQALLDAGAMGDALDRWGPAAVVLLMIAHCFVPFPAEILALAAGAAYGPWMGAGLIWAGALPGAALSFWLARALGRGAVDRWLPAGQRDRLDGFAQTEGAAALLGARLIPVIAFNLVNYAAGLTQVRFATFLWTTALGILPMTLLMTWMGARMREAAWTEAAAVGAAGLACVLIGRAWMRRARADR
ncbi:MAG: VTT domain-containing protein [Pseudomonadota bacterium]